MRSTDWYPDRAVRLYDRRRAHWDDRPVHESLVVQGDVADLGGEIEHRPYADVAEHLARMNHYTTLAAAQMHAQGRQARAWHLLCIRWRPSCATTSRGGASAMARRA